MNIKKLAQIITATAVGLTLVGCDEDDVKDAIASSASSIIVVNGTSASITANLYDGDDVEETETIASNDLGKIALLQVDPPNTYQLSYDIDADNTEIGKETINKATHSLYAAIDDSNCADTKHAFVQLKAENEFYIINLTSTELAPGILDLQLDDADITLSTDPVKCSATPYSQKSEGKWAVKINGVSLTLDEPQVEADHLVALIVYDINSDPVKVGFEVISNELFDK